MSASLARGFAAERSPDALVLRYRNPDAALALVGLPFALVVFAWMGWTVAPHVLGLARGGALALAGGLGGALGAVFVGATYALVASATNRTTLTGRGDARAADVEVQVGPLPVGRSRWLQGVEVRRVLAEPRVEVRGSGSRSTGGRLRQVTVYDVSVEDSAGRFRRLLVVNDAAAAETFRSEVACFLGLP